MKYAVLLLPHANARYLSGMLSPAQAELDTILSRIGVSAACEHEIIGGMDALTFTNDAPVPSPDLLFRHSLAYGLGEMRADGSIMPLNIKPRAYLGNDLASILKYKGKTNEQFTQHLINMALFATDYSADFIRKGALTLMDPMCGRGTTLFQAINRGWSAIGGDIDKGDIAEATRFFKRYLEYHRLKHTCASESRTLAGRASVKMTSFRFSDTNDKFALGDTLTLSLAHADAQDVARAQAKQSVHLICADLPYGVQHAAHASNEGGRAVNAESVLARALPAWRDALKTGGAVAISFNANTLKRERAREIMESANLRAVRSPAYDKLTHWVEQAVTRDVCVAVKSST